MRGKIEKKTDRKKQGLWVCFKTVQIFLLFLCALLVPEIIASVYDSRTLEKAEYLNEEVKTFEVSFQTFEEKLDALARCSEDGTAIHAVKTEEAEQKLDDGELTDIVAEEFYRLAEYGILELDFTLTPEFLMSREMYSMYTMEQTDPVQGFYYWRLTYGDEEKQMTVYLDTEFHKIYFVRWKYGDGDSEAQAAMGQAVTGKFYDVYMFRDYHEEYESFLVEDWLNRWLLYWEVEADGRETSVEIESEGGYAGALLLATGHRLPVSQKHEINDPGFMNSGITVFETMIQL